MAPCIWVCALCLSLLVACSGRDDTGTEDDTDRHREIYSHLGEDFELTDHRGKPFRLSTHPGVSLLFFGFTSCPDVCPLTMSRLQSVMHELGQDAGVTVLFVSVDPRRDTPARLAEYGESYDFPWIGLTTQEAGRIPAIARTFAAGIGRDEDGNIDHSSRIYLLDGADTVRDVFAADDDTDHMVRVIKSILD